MRRIHPNLTADRIRRRDLLKLGCAAVASATWIDTRRSAGADSDSPRRAPDNSASFLKRITHPLAIAMWDFSWLERRWPGAGYEDWDDVLGQLKSRGYDAVRIDAYPHLVATSPQKTWEILPCWNQELWGSPALTRVQVQPHLNQFIEKCARHNILVGLSTWWREDRENTRMKIKSPQLLAEVWRKTLDSIADAKLLDQILYVDLSNEFCIPPWTPWIPRSTNRHSPEGVRWMSDSIAVLKKAHPQLSYTFSFTSEYDTWQKQDVSMLDFLELHLWMTHFFDFYDKVDYHYEEFDPKGYVNLQKRAESLYRQNPRHWQACLEKGIDLLENWSRLSGKPLMTTECWGVVTYKDWPLLNWDWVKELCELGVKRAAKTGRWAAIATSNFCGPQFVGMWRDVGWHRRLTDIIHQAPLEFVKAGQP